MKSILAILVLTLLAIAPAYASAYRVELIVFRNLYPENLPRPPLKPGPADMAGAVDIADQSALVNNGIHLKSGGLSGIWDALGRSADYHPMLRVSWTQTGRSHGNAIPLRVHGKKTRNIASSRDRDRILPGLDGTAKVLSSPYLQLRLDLVLIRPRKTRVASGTQKGQSDTAGTQWAAFHLQGAQTFDSGSIHYFDNPAFGAIARVTKIR